MWKFNWGVFWSVLAALLSYAAVKYVVKTALGRHDPQWVNVIPNEREESEEVRQRKARLMSMSDPKEWDEIRRM